MTKKETAQILAILREYYPNGQAPTTNAWHLILEEYDYKIVEHALVNMVKSRDGIATMPAVGELIKHIKLLMPEDNTPIVLWREVDRMARKSRAMTQEEFEQASEPVKKYLGSLNSVIELGMMDATQYANERARFLKQIPTILERIEAQNGLPENVKVLTEKVSVMLNG